MQPTTVVASLDTETLQAILDGHEPQSPTASLEDPVFATLNYPLLARETARGIHSPQALLKRFSLTEQQFRLLLAHPPFVRMIKTERTLWLDSGNAGERARTYHREGQAMVASELVAMITDPNLAPTARLEAAKLSARIAGLDREPGQAGGAVASHFAVNIHLGDGRVDRIETVATTAPTLEGEAE